MNHATVDTAAEELPAPHAALDPRARLECRICWWVYDPADGCAQWQVAAGTPFAALPAHWRCPQCDAAPAQFMVVGEGAPC